MCKQFAAQIDIVSRQHPPKVRQIGLWLCERGRGGGKPVQDRGDRSAATLTEYKVPE